MQDHVQAYFRRVKSFTHLHSLQIVFRPLCAAKYNNNIGVGRFRILGGQGLEYWGGGGKLQQAHDVVTTSIRRNDVASTSCAH